MKRNIVINETRSALVISNNLADAVKQVATDSGIGEEIYAFDTALHICYAFKKIGGNEFKALQEEVSLQEFRSFATYNDNDASKVYKSLIKSVINE